MNKSDTYLTNISCCLLTIWKSFVKIKKGRAEKTFKECFHCIIPLVQDFFKMMLNQENIQNESTLSKFFIFSCRYKLR